MRKILLVLFMLPFITGCSKSYYYQVFQVKSEAVQSYQNRLVYSNDDCLVFYNFWGANGNPGFTIYNHTDKNIFIDLNRTHFIRNEVAYDYFLNRETQTGYSKTRGRSIAVSKSKQGTFYNSLFTPQIGDGLTYKKAISATKTETEAVTNSNSLTYKEKDIVCVPPHSRKQFSEYTIAAAFYSTMEKKSLQFSEENSPLIFSNIIAYQREGDSDYNYIENKFYVESIEKRLKIKEQNLIDEDVKNYAPERFYVKSLAD